MLLVMFGDERNNIVYIDLDLLDQFNFKDYILVDALLIRLPSVSELVVYVDIHTLVVLHIALAEELGSLEIVKALKDIDGLEQTAEQPGKLLLLLFQHNWLTHRILLQQFIHQLAVAGVVLALIIIAIIVIFVLAQQHNAASLLVPKQSQRLVGGILQVPEADNVAEGLD